MTTTIPAYAKINWTLEVLGRRPDGYHEVRTVLQTVSLFDRLTFSEAESGVHLTCEAPGVPLDDSNLIVRAARLILSASGVDRGIRIHLEKHIPMAAGLGGGSSNAAVTLLTLERLWSTDLGPARLRALAASLGADVPFFLFGGTALGIGRGDEVYQLDDISFGSMLLVNPRVAVATADAYRGLPVELTLPYVADMMPFSLEAARRGLSAPMGVLDSLRNDLEPSVLAAYPRLGEIRTRMRASGAVATMMSGSGSTFFALFDSDAARDVAEKELFDTGWWSAPVRTVSSGEYRRALGLV